MSKIIVIQGSARSHGNTNKVINYLSEKLEFNLLDLKTKSFTGYDYKFENKNDDFLPTIESIIQQYDTMIFASPVYWYCMSGLMKNFLDRFSDLLGPHKELGRRLREKSIAVISCSGHNDLKDGFYMPFVESANYLGMEYKGQAHTWLNKEQEIDDAAKINLDNLAKLLNIKS